MTTATLQRNEHAVIAERNEQEHYGLPHGTSLGAGCCDWCGRELGDVKQIDGTYRDYHSTGYCED